MTSSPQTIANDPMRWQPLRYGLLVASDAAFGLFIDAILEAKRLSDLPPGLPREDIERVVAEAVLKERKACADTAGGMTGPGNTVEDCHGYSNACREISAAIRARGES